tara:strand:- start:566 stop:1996 length:1431 start_codon:yes stop_codon:yes gene_type:complete
MKKKIFPVILSGGQGLRLWPASQTNLPKQFLSIESKRSLLYNTFIRLKDNLFEPLTIIGNKEHRFLLKKELKENKIKYRSILLEPMSKNTMAPVLLSVLHIINENPDSLILVLPADHIIINKKKFIDSIKKATNLAKDGYLMTFGVKPTHPNTSLGYIKTDSKKKKNGYLIKKFVEKPDLNTAKKLLKGGNCFWNSGIFFFSSQTFISECNIFAKESLNLAKKNFNQRKFDLDFEFFLSPLFKKFKNQPIDKAIMEKTKNGAVIPLSPKWSDVGSWSSIWDVMKKDSKGNVFKDQNVISHNVKNSLIWSTNKKVAAIGVEDMIIIEDNDGILISKKGNNENLKNLVEEVLKINIKNIISNQPIFRPWGEYKSIHVGNGFLIKILKIYPKSKISLQYHNKRSEHWVVVEGTATVTKGKKTFKLKTNQSTFIKKGEIHRLANDTNNSLTLVEVQTGEYLKEDDIIRLEDIYGRTKISE